jgi:hypothetical protein
MADDRYLYVIGERVSQSPVKIGIAANPARRLRELQAASPARLRLLFSVEVAGDVVRKAEAVCHRMLRACRSHGEWFTTDSETAANIVTEVIARRLWEKPKRRPRMTDELRLHIRIPPELKGVAREMAEEDGRTVSNLVLKVLRDEAKRRGKLN